VHDRAVVAQSGAGAVHDRAVAAREGAGATQSRAGGGHDGAEAARGRVEATCDRLEAIDYDGPAMLIRPDGHVAWVEASGERAFEDALNRWC
jgi:predicted amidohydrolase YtcJ